MAVGISTATNRSFGSASVVSSGKASGSLTRTNSTSPASSTSSSSSSRGYVSPVVYTSQEAAQSAAASRGGPAVVASSGGKSIVLDVPKGGVTYDSSDKGSLTSSASSQLQTQAASYLPAQPKQPYLESPAQVPQQQGGYTMNDANFSSVYGAPGVSSGYGSYASTTLLATSPEQATQIKEQQQQAQQSRLVSQGNYIDVSGNVYNVRYPHFELTSRLQSTPVPSASSLTAKPTRFDDLAYFSQQKITRQNEDAASSALGKFTAFQTQQDKLTMGMVPDISREQAKILGKKIDAYSTKEFAITAGISAATLAGAAVIPELVAPAVAGIANPVSRIATTAGLEVVGSLALGGFAVAKEKQIEQSIASFKERPASSTRVIGTSAAEVLSFAAGASWYKNSGGKPVENLYKETKFNMEVNRFARSIDKYPYSSPEPSNTLVTTNVNGKVVVEPLVQTTLKGEYISSGGISAANAKVNENTIFSERLVSTDKGDFFTGSVNVNPLRDTSFVPNVKQYTFGNMKVVGADVFKSDIIPIKSDVDLLRLPEGSVFTTRYEGRPIGFSDVPSDFSKSAPVGKQSDLFSFGASKPLTKMESASISKMSQISSPEFSLVPPVGRTLYTGEASFSNADMQLYSREVAKIAQVSEASVKAREFTFITPSTDSSIGRVYYSTEGQFALLREPGVSRAVLGGLGGLNPTSLGSLATPEFKQPSSSVIGDVLYQRVSSSQSPESVQVVDFKQAVVPKQEPFVLPDSSVKLDYSLKSLSLQSQSSDVVSVGETLPVDVPPIVPVSVGPSVGGELVSPAPSILLPPLFPMGEPNAGGFGYSLLKGFRGRKAKYTPSVAGVDLGVKALDTKGLQSGIGIRGVPGLSEPRRKKGKAKAKGRSKGKSGGGVKLPSLKLPSFSVGGKGAKLPKMGGFSVKSLRGRGRGMRSSGSGGFKIPKVRGGLL